MRFNPLVPGDSEASGLPVIFWRIRVVNTTSETLSVSLMLSVGNFIGQRLRSLGADDSQPTFEVRAGRGFRGLLLGERGLKREDEEWGTFAAAVVADQAAWVGPTWAPGKWDQGTWRLWREFVEEGKPGEPEPEGAWAGTIDWSKLARAGTLGTALQLLPLGTNEASFVFSWHFPNRRAWTFAGPGPAGGSRDDIVGNYYTAGSEDAWDVLEKELPNRDELEATTVDFVSSVLRSDLSDTVKEAALFNLSTLRSPTVFRTAEGFPFGWEGVLDHVGSCPGSCTHVWNYEFATPFLFGDLARQMRELEFRYATAASGAMSFRIALPLTGPRWPWAAADGQFGCIVKLYREWQLSGDDDFLRRLWPGCKRALEFAWVEGGWDADADGVAEGCQHNTMDVEYFGPNPIIQGWYLAALLAGARMADHLSEREFSRRCGELARQGAEWTEAHLFNGDYYEQDMRPGDFGRVRPSSR